MDIVLYIVLAVLVFFTIIYTTLSSNELKLPSTSFVLALGLGIYVAVKLGTYPILIWGDKYNYMYFFIEGYRGVIHTTSEIGWYYFNILCNKLLFQNFELFFLLIAFIYVGGYFQFAKKYFAKPYIYFFILTCFVSMGFAEYGVNTLRAGLALSLLMVAIANKDKTWLLIVLLLISLSIHKTMALPITAFLITQLKIGYKWYLGLWFFCFLLSALNIVPAGDILMVAMDDESTKKNIYILADDNILKYNAGFRVDFILYSIIPIIVGWYYIFKLNVKDVFYIRLYNTYILVNAFWLLVIRMNFTDRVAYLSWFLMPFLLLYPAIKYELPINQRRLVVFVLLGSFAFNSWMFFKR